MQDEAARWVLARLWTGAQAKGVCVWRLDPQRRDRGRISGPRMRDLSFRFVRPGDSAVLPSPSRSPRSLPHGCAPQSHLRESELLDPARLRTAPKRALPTDPDADICHHEAIEADEDLRRKGPALWWLAAIVTVIVHACASMRLWWLRRLMR